MKSESIQDYILKSKHNLGIAAAIGAAWPQARDKLVSGFLDRLDARLKRKLRGSESCRWGGSFFVDQWAGYYIWKPAWKDRYSIGLQCGEYGKCVTFGLARDTNDTREQPLREELLIAVQKIHPSAKSMAWWEAKIALRSPASDWREPEVLWRMHTDVTFQKGVAEQMLDVAEQCGSIADKLVRKKK